jgi:small subunit ribosomal protein S21
MSGVKLRDGESFDSLIRRFRKVLAKDGILRDVKRLQYYEKPSEKKKKEVLASKRRVTRRVRKPE